MHLEVGAVSSLDLSFLDQVTPHIEQPSKPLTELNVVVARSTISHLLILDLLSLSIVQKNAFHSAMTVLKSTSHKPAAWVFIYGVVQIAPKVFSSIEHVVKENAQVMFELEN